MAIVGSAVVAGVAIAIGCSVVFWVFIVDCWLSSVTEHLLGLCHALFA